MFSGLPFYGLVIIRTIFNLKNLVRYLWTFKQQITLRMIFLKHNSLKLFLVAMVRHIFKSYIYSMFFRVQLIQGTGFSEYRLFNVQVFQGPGFLGFRFFRVRVQVLEVALLIY